MTGTTLTTSDNFLSTTISMGLSLYVVSIAQICHLTVYLRVAGWLYKEKTAMNAGVLDVTFSLCSELFPEVDGMLLLDVFHDGVPAGFYQSLTQAFLGQGSLPASVVH